MAQRKLLAQLPGYTGFFGIFSGWFPRLYGVGFTVLWRGVHRSMAYKTPIDTPINANLVRFSSKQDAIILHPPTEQQHITNRATSGVRVHTLVEPSAACRSPLAPFPPHGYQCPQTHWTPSLDIDGRIDRCCARHKTANQAPINSEHEPEKTEAGVPWYFWPYPGTGVF